LTLILDGSQKSFPGSQVRRGKSSYLLPNKRPSEKVSYQRGHSFQVLFQCEVTCIEEMEFGVFQILRRFRAEQLQHPWNGGMLPRQSLCLLPEEPQDKSKTGSLENASGSLFRKRQAGD